MAINIHSLPTDLATRRPLFHSEADFQHALVWTIQQHHPEAGIRLETRPERGIRLDILVRMPEERIAIELKYLIARFDGTINAVGPLPDPNGSSGVM